MPTPRQPTTSPTRVETGVGPLVTALICNYNYANYIGATVKSALAQTWPHLEVLVVDDGSTDGSRSVLSGFGDRIRVIHKDNGGQASAFNVGIAQARGEIICFLDSDDLWYPHKVERIVAKYGEGDWGLVCHDLDEIDAEGRALGVTHIQKNGTRLVEGDLYRYLTKNGFASVFAPTSGMSLRADVARAILPLPEHEWRICADNVLAAHALCHAPVGVLPEALGQYRYHGANGYSVIRLDDAAGRIIALTGPTRRYLAILDHLAQQGLPLDHEPRDDYFLSALGVDGGVSRRSPGASCSSSGDATGPLWLGATEHSLLKIAKFLVLDNARVRLLLAGMQSPYSAVRERFVRGRLRGKICALRRLFARGSYLMSRDAVCLSRSPRIGGLESVRYACPV